MRRVRLEEMTELDLLRDQLEGCRNDLLVMSKYKGESPVLDANIRHKAAQIAALEEKIARIEAGEQGTSPAGL